MVDGVLPLKQQPTKEDGVLLLPASRLLAVLIAKAKETAASVVIKLVTLRVSVQMRHHRLRVVLTVVRMVIARLTALTHARSLVATAIGASRANPNFKLGFANALVRRSHG